MKCKMMTNARDVGCKKVIPCGGGHFVWQQLELFWRLELGVVVWLVPVLFG